MLQHFHSRLKISLPTGRNRRLLAGVSTGIVTKMVTFSVTLMTVPMTLTYLGPDEYGVWVTMVSLLAWVSMVDLGIANGLIPALSSAFGKKNNDLARGYVATAAWALLCISLVVGSVLASLWGNIDWSRLFNLHDARLQQEVSSAMAIAVAIFLLSLPLTVTMRVLLAYQQGPKANVVSILTSLAGLVGLFFVIQTHANLVLLVIGYSGSQLIVSVLAAIWLFSIEKPELRPTIMPRPRDAKYVLSLGGFFFVNQVATLLIFQKDIILITNLLGPLQAAQYSVMWQMFLYLNIIHILIAPYLGPAIGEAFSSKDANWLRIAIRRYLMLSVGITVPLVIILVIYHASILRLWVGTSVSPDTDTIVWLAIWSIVLSVQSPIIAILNNTGRLRIFTIFYVVSALVNLLLSIVLIKNMGISGGVISSVVTVTLLVIFPSGREVIRLLRESRR